jgi:tetratricopeptide (TPR) repeat protein
MKIIGVSIFIFILFLQACSSKGQNVKPGLNDSIVCASLPGQLYCLYLPQNPNKVEKMPVLFLFDPAALAKTTVEQYKTLADKYGIILACSYNSKNGPADENKIAANAMIGDVLEKFPADETKLFVSGLSGGSRFSYLFASQNAKIKGVIACGAFYPGNTSSLTKPLFNYSGIAGTFDFNFPEGLSMKYTLARQNFPFQFITFEGKHEWPADSIFERALVFQLSRLDEYKNLVFKSTLLEQRFLNTAKLNGDYMNAAWILENLMIADKNRQSEFHDSLELLVNSELYKKQESAFLGSFRMEDSLRNEISEALKGILMTCSNKFDAHLPLTWWKIEINKLSLLEGNSKEIYTRNSGKRLKAQIGVMLWETNRHLMQQNFYVQALELADILLVYEPENATYFALKAEVLAAQNKAKEAKTYLKQAIDKGFTMENPYLGSSEILRQVYNDYIKK